MLCESATGFNNLTYVLRRCQSNAVQPRMKITKLAVVCYKSVSLENGCKLSQMYSFKFCMVDGNH